MHCQHRFDLCKMETLKEKKLTSGNLHLASLRQRLTGTPLAKALADVIALEDEVDPMVCLSEAKRRLGARSSAGE